MPAIGVFDSGVGGLTVVKAIRKLMPEENIVYIGDTARVPYGNKSRKSIIEFSKQNVMFLLERKVKLIVVACNTASAVALDELKKTFNIPILGVIEAGAKKATETGEKSVGVIGTYRTVKSEAYTAAIHDENAGVNVHSKACPLFVPIIEENLQKHEAARLIIKEYLDELSIKTNTLILGCTHYPLIKDEISGVYPGLNLVDSADAVAEQVRDTLEANGMRAKVSGGRFEYYASDVSENFIEIAKRILEDDNLHIEERNL